MIPDEIRRNHILTYEGQALAAAQHCGADGAVDLAHCAVDGIMNAIIRLEGREGAANYAFALADRVAGGLREPTALPWLVQAPEVVVVPVVDLPKPEPAKRMNFWAIYLIGYGFGFFTGFGVGMLR